MDQPKKDNKIARNVILAGVLVAALGILTIIGIIVFGIIAAIAIPSFVKTKDKAAINVVEMRVEDAVEATSNYLQELPVEEATSESLHYLSTHNTPDNPDDDATNPCDKSLPAFAREPGACVVTITVENSYTAIVTGYDADGNELVKKSLAVEE